MNGVEILATEEVATEFAFNLEFALIILGISFVVGLVVGGIISFIEMDWDALLLALATSLCLGLLAGTLGGYCNPKETAYETQYKVTISDSVSMTEFYECYEIIDQEGKIFTVREKSKE